MFNAEEIKQRHIDQNRHIMSMCGDDSLEKALSKDEFSEKYSTDHEVYSAKNIKEFEDNLAAKIQENPEEADSLMEKAISELQPLQKVLVKSDTSVETFYVKKVEAKEENEDENKENEDEK